MRFQVEVRIMESLRLDIQEYMKFIFIDSLMSKKPVQSSNFFLLTCHIGDLVCGPCSFSTLVLRPVISQ